MRTHPRSESRYLCCCIRGSTAAWEAGWLEGHGWMTAVFTQSPVHAAITLTATVLRRGHERRDCIERPATRGVDDRLGQPTTPRSRTPFFDASVPLVDSSRRRAPTVRTTRRGQRGH